MQKLKHNYSSNLKSMSTTISPFLIILTMTHKMKFVSNATSMFVTWDVNWILVTATFSPIYIWFRKIYISIQYLWDGRVPVLMDHECSSTLGSSMCLLFLWKLVERLQQRMLSCLFHNSTNTGVIPQKLVTIRLADIKLVSKSLR